MSSPLILHHADEPGAITVAERILDMVQAPIVVGEERLTVGASIGMVLFPQHGKDAGSLLQRADVAMYQAKRGHVGYAVYDAEQDEYSPGRHAIAGDLREALEHNRLQLQYQPQVTCLTGRTARVEALARWPHPKRGMVPPADFIPLAERTGLIEPLTTWVLRQALEQCAQWHTAGREVGVAVNLSPHSLSDPRLTETIEQVVRAVGADFHWLELEITESALMADVERSMRVLHGLHNLGIRISVDDFGTG